MKQLKAILATSIITGSLLTTTAFASNHDFTFTMQAGANYYTRTSAYSKDDDDKNWYYNVKSFKNEDKNNKAITYLCTANEDNNVASDWVKITGTTGKSKSKRYYWRADTSPGTCYKLQGRCDQYIATLSGKFCP